MVNALASCNQLIVPVQTEFLALKGLERMLHTLDMIMRSRKMSLPYLIVPALFDRRTRASVDSLRMLQEKYPEHLWSGAIPVDTQFREASRVGAPLSAVFPHARGVLAYQALLDSLLGLAPVPPVVGGPAELPDNQKLAGGGMQGAAG
jgi:chromosome partitioning protein